mgnify:CR=1 FL=1
MTLASSPTGRRERNKQVKLERIIAAAGALFAERGVDDVTTQEIADAADIGTGTLTVFTQIAAEALQIPTEKVSIVWGDTQLPRASPVYGS